MNSSSAFLRSCGGRQNGSLGNGSRETHLSVHDELVGGMHLRLKLLVLRDERRVETRVTPHERHVLLLHHLCARQHRVHVLRPLRLPHNLVLQPLLHRRALLDDRLLVLRVDVRELLVRGRRVGHVPVDRLAQLGDDARAVLGFFVPEGDGVSQGLEPVELRDVDGLGRVLAFVAVEPVLGDGERGKKLLLLCGLDVRGIPVVELAAHVVDVLFERILAVL